MQSAESGLLKCQLDCRVPALKRRRLAKRLRDQFTLLVPAVPLKMRCPLCGTETDSAMPVCRKWAKPGDLGADGSRRRMPTSGSGGPGMTASSAAARPRLSPLAAAGAELGHRIGAMTCWFSRCRLAFRLEERRQ